MGRAGIDNDRETMIIILSWPLDNHTVKTNTVASYKSMHSNEIFVLFVDDFSTCSGVTVNSTHVLIITHLSLYS